MITIKMLDYTKSFADNKDKAREIRVHTLLPGLAAGDNFIIDFSGIESTTQSFIHALISDACKKHGEKVFKLLAFKNCNKYVKEIITTVINYSIPE